MEAGGGEGELGKMILGTKVQFFIWSYQYYWRHLGVLIFIGRFLPEFCLPVSNSCCVK
jgi:hypothetical protein